MAPRRTGLVLATVGLVVSLGLGVFGLAALFGVGAAGAREAEFVVALGLAGAASLALASFTAWLAGRDFSDDLVRVDEGLRAMIDDEAPSADHSLRTLDELGQLVRAFDALRRAFEDSLAREARLLREAEAAEAVKGEFLQAVSHELRTPLNAILGFADVLLGEIDGPLNADQIQDLRIIRGAGEHLVALFNDVLDLSAAATDQLRLERVRVSPGAIVSQVAAELRGLRGGKSVDLVVEIDGDVPEVAADPKRLRQIVTNLGSNAIKFTDEGEVRLQVGRVAGGVAIRVVDTGIGIPEDALDRIFEEFDRFVESTPERRRRGGAGLGLAIAKSLVELHGGRLTAESQVGQGSTFTVFLPAEGP
ncbi:MAG: HAMP domain-containing histidine kinase [Sandaracinus sp.]|nr:HAMP domain-containing histidine kinase [Sandaracinus sp.]MCB9633068.1 HAMP domain-containing histidine kinase [Sandaracinus sp.]